MKLEIREARASLQEHREWKVAIAAHPRVAGEKAEHEAARALHDPGEAHDKRADGYGAVEVHCRVRDRQW